MKGVMEIPVIIGLVCLNQSSMFKLNCKVWLCIHQGVNFSANDLGGPHPASWTELRVLWDSLCVSSMSFLLEFLAYFFLLWLPVGFKKKKNNTQNRSILSNEKIIYNDLKGPNSWLL